MGYLIIIATLVLLVPAVLLLALSGTRRSRSKREASKVTQQPAAEGGEVTKRINDRSS